MTEVRPVPSPPAPDWSAAGPRRWAAALGAAGTILWVIGVVLDPAQAYFSYLVAYVFALGLALGALALIMIEHLAGAIWFVVMRRLTEQVAAALPALAVLFLPVALGVRWLYPWTDLSLLTPHDRGLVALKTPYLNLPFFFTRAGIYFISWIVLVGLLRRWSLRQDIEPGPRWQAPQEAISAPGLIVLAFTLTFAAFDWVMSLAPTWVSTIFGVQVFSGAMVGTLALLSILVGRSSAASRPLAEVLQRSHLGALGKLLFTFVIFWAYTSFAQLLIIWIADVPEEIRWYAPRLAGSWLWTGTATAIGQFAVPFVVLLSYRLKRRASVLVLLGAWTLVAHYVEVYWIVMPQLHPASARPHWIDAAAAAMVLGSTAAWVSWQACGHSALAVGDPVLQSALEYRET